MAEEVKETVAPNNAPPTTQPISTAGVIDIGYASNKLIGYALLSLMFVAIGLHPNLGSRGWMDYLGITFFGVCAAVFLARFLQLRLSSPRPVITISPDGFRDRRVVAKFIPWSAITRVWTWRYLGSGCMVLDLYPAVREQLGLTRYRRLTRIANRFLGIDGVAITPSALTVDYPTLLQTTLAYTRAYNPQFHWTAENEAAYFTRCPRCGDRFDTRDKRLVLLHDGPLPHLAADQRQ